MSERRAPRLALAGMLALVLSACASHAPNPVVMQETFDSSSTFSRGFDATPSQTCEAARRALLSQGYIATSKTQELIEAGYPTFNRQSFLEGHMTPVLWGSALRRRAARHAARAAT